MSLNSILHPNRTFKNSIHNLTLPTIITCWAKGWRMIIGVVEEVLADVPFSVWYKIKRRKKRIGDLILGGIRIMGTMNCNVETWMSVNLAGSSTLACNRKRVCSFLPRSSRSRRSRVLLTPERHFHGFHVNRNTIFLLSALRRWSLSVYASSLDLPLLPFSVNEVNHHQPFSAFTSIFVFY